MLKKKKKPIAVKAKKAKKIVKPKKVISKTKPKKKKFDNKVVDITFEIKETEKDNHFNSWYGG